MDNLKINIAIYSWHFQMFENYRCRIIKNIDYKKEFGFFRIYKFKLL